MLQSERGWRALLTDDDEVALYCQTCAGREFEEPGELVDCAGIVRWLGITRAAAEAIMRRVPKVEIEGLRKVYVRSADVRRLLAESTRAP